MNRRSALCGLLGMTLLAIGLVLLPTPTARAADNVCAPGHLVAARVAATVSLHHDGHDFSRVDSEFVIKVPRSWERASDLLLNGDTERYRAAMRCLVRPSGKKHVYWADERRLKAPRVTADASWVTVRHWSTTWVNDRRSHRFGPWKLEAGNRMWTLAFVPPYALKRSEWKTVHVDLGGRGARSVSPAPSRGTADSMTWSSDKIGSPPAIRLMLQPPTAKALAARMGAASWMPADWMLSGLWDLSILALTVLAARRLAREPQWMPLTSEEEEATDCVRLFATLITPLVLADGLLTFASLWAGYRAAYSFIIVAVLGLLFCAVAGPLLAAWPLILAAATMAVAVGGWPQFFHLPAGLEFGTGDAEALHAASTRGGVYWLMLACVCVVFIWLIGCVASVLKLWRSGLSAIAIPRPNGHFRLRMLIPIALVSMVLPAASVWACETTWRQDSWLSAHDSAYQASHRAELLRDLAWFPSDWYGWIVPDWWWLITLGIVVMLKARATSPRGSSVVPDAAEWFALRVLFTVGASLALGWFAGISGYVVSVAIGWVVLSGLAMFGGRASILGRDVMSGIALREVVHEGQRRRLVESARRFRELHAELRRLEQGQGDEKRAALERRLDRLHRWPTPGWAASAVPGLRSRVSLPDSVGPVDLALAWGPKATWWENGRRAALFASVIGMPATAVAFWAERVKGTFWDDTLKERFGLLSTVETVFTWQITWATTGFVLGAMWRLLPGRRGPMRAASLSLAFIVPAMGDRLGNILSHQAMGTTMLTLSLILLVLTLTGAAMDIDTFRGERRYWPTRAGLLLSIYQLRTVSLQFAFLLAQIIALLSIWKQLGSDPTAPQLEPPGREAADSGRP